jgi:hypothetical protein
MKAGMGNRGKISMKWKVLAAALLVIAVTSPYLVQEWVAALVVFTLMFALVAAGVFVLYLFDWAGQRTLEWAEDAPMTQRFREITRRWMPFLRAGDQ